MKVIDLINQSQQTAFSFEILPPLKGNSIQKVYNVIDKLKEFDPKYINITSHHSEHSQASRLGGYRFGHSEQVWHSRRASHHLQGIHQG